MQNLMGEIHLQEAAGVMRDIWYAYAEGFLPKMTGTAADDSILEQIDDTLPRGWTASIMPDGTVLAGHPVWANNDMKLIVCHINREGQQVVFERPLD
ncbi:hypothetical protein [Alicyclobacillus sp. SO9]|uniref:hypothetical protein n=1 Tax=Alicyclobacillus sp. SO9 TaxID=2665646 RepID=UPI0018E769C5|nr:hypothetical protein [Alicyclobacillus sp. SO9]QQE79365.1 hypothetical protein GI364_02330 [Alicyclobacillus sp. SO9]